MLSEVEMLRELFPVILHGRIGLQLQKLHCVFHMAKNKMWCSRYERGTRKEMPGWSRAFSWLALSPAWNVKNKVVFHQEFLPFFLIGGVQ